MAGMSSISQFTRIHLDDGSTLVVKESAVELATAINSAYLHGEVAVKLTSPNGEPAGIMHTRVVKWD